MVDSTVADATGCDFTSIPWVETHWYLHKFRLSGIPPPEGGGWFNPDLQDTKRLLWNPTTGRWWMVQPPPARSITENKGWASTIHHVPVVGLREIFPVSVGWD